MKIENIAVEKLIPYARNAKKHDAAQVSKLAGSIREFGFNNPVLIDADNGIIAGHGRVMAAQQLGLADVPCIRLGHLSENQRRAYILADNRLAEINSGWDEELLKLEVADIDWGDIKGLSVDDFEFGEIEFGEDEREQEKTDTDAEPQIDKAEELRAKWGVEPGQLWELGDHRLLCGDSTKKEDVEKALGGASPLLMVTDPPYGVNYEGGTANAKKREKLHGDDSADLFGASLSVAALVMPSGAWYIWHADRMAEPVYAAIRSKAWEVRALLIWNKVKPHYGAPMAHYCQKHEPCLYAVKGNAGFSGPSNECTVWDIVQPKVNEHHPTQKPVECMARPIRNHDSEFVYEPFSGSGTTIIACEQLGRKCRAIEISPAYVAVAIQRWADATGKTPRKL